MTFRIQDIQAAVAGNSEVVAAGNAVENILKLLQERTGLEVRCVKTPKGFVLQPRERGAKPWSSPLKTEREIVQYVQDYLSWNKKSPQKIAAAATNPVFVELKALILKVSGDKASVRALTGSGRGRVQIKHSNPGTQKGFWEPDQWATLLAAIQARFPGTKAGFIDEGIRRSNGRLDTVPGSCTYADLVIPQVAQASARSVTAASLTETYTNAKPGPFDRPKKLTSDLFPVGTTVEVKPGMGINSGKHGVVIRHNPNDFNAPTVSGSPERLQPRFRCIRFQDRTRAYISIESLEVD